MDEILKSMKYLIFTLAIFGMIPAALWMTLKRQWLRPVAFAIPFLALVYDGTSINFFSHEFYRGTARGMEVSAVFLCAALLLVTLLLVRGRVQLLPDTGSKLYLVYFLLCMMSMLNAANVLFSFFEVWKMVMMCLVFLAVYHYLRLYNDIDIFWYGMSAVIILGFPTIILGYIAGVYQARGVFPHQNSMGMYMLLASTILLSRCFNRREFYRNIFFGGTFFIAAMSLTLTYSRGALLCLPIGCAITIGVSLIYNLDARKLRMLGVLGLGCLLLFLLFLPRVLDRFESAPSASAETRINLAKAAKNMMVDSPILGVGVNNWGIKINPPYKYSRHRDPLRGFTDETKDGIVETIYLLVGAECGVPAMLVLMGWFGYYWLTAFRLLRKLARTTYFYIPAGLLGGLTAIYLQSVLEWVLKQPVNFIELVMMFAILAFINTHSRRLISEETAAEKKECS